MSPGGPIPLVNNQPVQKRANAAEQFRNEHTPSVPQPDKICPEKVNQQHPVLAEEMAKRRWIRDPTMPK